MQSQLPKRKQFMSFFSLLILFLFVGCNSPQNSSPGNSLTPASSSPNPGHLTYTLSDQSLSAFHSTTGTEAWRADTSGTYQVALATKDTVYAVSDKLYVFDAVNGQTKWSQPLGSALSAATTSNIAADDHGVYIASNNIVFAFNVKDGSILWRTELQPPSSLTGAVPDGGLLAPNPAIMVKNGIIYTNAGGSLANASGSFVAALQTSDGKQLWSTTIPDDTVTDNLGLSHFQPVYDITLQNNILYAATSTDMVALNAQNGQILWQTITGGIDSMVITNDVMYITVNQDVVGSPQSGSYQLQLTNGKLSNLNLPTGSADFTHGYANNTVYMTGGPTGGDILAVQLSSGTTKWHVEGTGQIDFLDVLGGNVYSVRDDGLITLLKGNNGRVIWSQTFPKGQGKDIITDGNEIYMPGDGIVVAIDVHTGNTLWSAQTNGNRSIFTSEGLPLVFMSSN